jgi:hypothetical protein
MTGADLHGVYMRIGMLIRMPWFQTGDPPVADRPSDQRARRACNDDS